jgi:hypothetical protein
VPRDLTGCPGIASYTRQQTVDALDDAQQREIDAVIGVLRADARDLRVFFPVLAAKLADALPGSVDVERQGSIFARRRPIRRLSVRLDDELLFAELTPEGLSCRRASLRDGMTEDVDFQAWMRILLAALWARARTVADASAVLRTLVT